MRPPQECRTFGTYPQRSVSSGGSSGTGSWPITHRGSAEIEEQGAEGLTPRRPHAVREHEPPGFGLEGRAAVPIWLAWLVELGDVVPEPRFIRGREVEVLAIFS